MLNVMPTLTTLVDLLMVAVGFSLIIFVHELGHFAAARWAKVRVMAFALGFGPALVSYRKGLGVRAGSSEAAYRKLVRERGDGRGLVPGVSPTEYRLNALPLGGYVKMLGQDDADPSRRSDASDSYNSASVPKRMVIISAGVVMNLITAALLFVVVFWFGLRAEPSRLGYVEPGSPAAAAEAVGSAAAQGPGLRAGDTIVSIDGGPVEAFKDVTIATMMARAGRTLEVGVTRPGVDGTLGFRVTPREDKLLRLQTIGVAPASSGTLVGGKSLQAEGEFAEVVKRLGLPATLEPGMTLEAVGGVFAEQSGLEMRGVGWGGAGLSGAGLEYLALQKAVEASGGRPLVVTFTRADRTLYADVTVRPRAELQASRLTRAEGTVVVIEHPLGLVPVMRVDAVMAQGAAAGLKAGDVFARIGDVEFPSLDAGLREVRTPGRRSVNIEVLRATAAGVERVVLPKVPLKDGKVGFYPSSTASLNAATLNGAGDDPGHGALDGALVNGSLGTMVTSWPSGQSIGSTGEAEPGPVGAGLRVLPGSMITAVDGEAVSSMTQVREAIRRASGYGAAEVRLTLLAPALAGQGGSGPARSEERMLAISAQDREALAALTWTSPLGPELFEPAEVLIKRDGPISAIGQGLRETRGMVLQTYLTFARLFQGSVKVEHLKGPVGIAHVGTIIAERGFIWLLFFMAAVSVNLAVVNFLPLPVVDGGHFVFLCYEGLTGRAVSVAVQNIATIVGLVLIASLFLVTTYNDISRLLTG